MNNLKDFGQKLDLNNYLFGLQYPEKTADKFVILNFNKIFNYNKKNELIHNYL